MKQVALLLRKNLSVLKEIEELRSEGGLLDNQVNFIIDHTLATSDEVSFSENFFRKKGSYNLNKNPRIPDSYLLDHIDQRLEHAKNYLRAVKRKHSLIAKQLKQGDITLKEASEYLINPLSEDYVQTVSDGYRKLEMNELEYWLKEGFVDERVYQALKKVKGHKFLHAFQDLYDQLKMAGDDKGKVESFMRQKQSLEKQLNNPIKQIRDVLLRVLRR